MATRRAFAALAAAAPRRFTERQRRALTALADTIVPAGDGMPAASEAGALPYLESLAAREAGLGRDLRGALAIAERRSRTRHRAACDVLGAQERVDLLQAMEKEEADAFRLLRDLVYEAYYTQAAVWKALGYEFIGAAQAGPPLPPFEDALLERVRALPRLDLPEEGNRVELDARARDSSGIPAPRVTYAFGQNSLRMLDHGARMARQALEAAGAVEIRDTGAPNVFAHLMGTARMGTDPRRSVVDAWNRAHDVPNLFIVDGSSFTTASAVNPTSTIGALALRAADGIWERRREWTAG